jgi:hypothetical protein
LDSPEACLAPTVEPLLVEPLLVEWLLVEWLMVEG